MRILHFHARACSPIIPTMPTMTRARKRAPVRIRILAGSAVALGPGKSELLDAIAETGSISAAARELGMSYRRAWILVHTMNSCFAKPLVTATKGGRDGGGAELTSTGRAVLADYKDVSRIVSARFSRYVDGHVPARRPTKRRVARRN